MKNLWKALIFSALSVVAFGGCGDKDEKIDITLHRFERVLFDNEPAVMADSLRAFQRQFPSGLLTTYPDDPYYMQQVAGFTGDSIVQAIYRITSSRYSDLGWLEEELGKALGKARKLDKEIAITHFATYVSCSFDYGNRVRASREDSSVLVSIDQYAIGGMEQYSYFGLPLYLVQLSDSAYIAADVMAEIARQYIAAPKDGSPTMLDMMVAEGKVLYFLDQTMPDAEPSLKMRLSDEQLEWCRKNEPMVWAYFIQHELLYEKDYTRYHNFIDEAPKTNAFKDSAPRVALYIGYQIVKNYMEQSGDSMAELFAATDSQALLAASKYKP